MLQTTTNERQLHKDLIHVSEANINNPFFKDCDYIMRASGESMQNIIKRNDLLGLWNVEQWKDFIPYGEVYAILTTDGHLMVKKIIQGKDDNHFTLLSEPEETEKHRYRPQQISKALISKIFVVKSSHSTL